MIRGLNRAAPAVGFALALLAAAPAFAENLVANGSFEKPVVAPGSFVLVSTGQTIGRWTVVGVQGSVAPISGDFQQDGISFVARKGKQWLDLTGTSNSATGVEQSVRTTPGGIYELSFSVGNVRGGIFGTSSSVQVYVDGEPLMVAVNSRGGDEQAWKRFSAQITATGRKTTIRFINGDGGSDNHNGLDAVSLVALSGRD